MNDELQTSTGPGGSMEDVPQSDPSEPTTYIVGRSDLAAAKKEIEADGYEQVDGYLVFRLDGEEVGRFYATDRIYVKEKQEE